jgi:hypothetical protein
MSMTPDERRELIDKLRTETADSLAELERRQREREADPAAMLDWLKAEQDAPPACRSEAYVERDGTSAGLLYRVQENAPASAVMGEEPDWSGWQAWLDGHLAIERERMLDGVAGAFSLFRAELRTDREAGEARLQREITELRTQLQHDEERRAAVAEVRREYAGVEHERLAGALVIRDQRIDALEQRMDILLRFLSLQGLEPPRF